MTQEELLEILTRRGVVTTDPARIDVCCGQPRDADGFCTYREGHPIYVDPVAEEASANDCDCPGAWPVHRKTCLVEET